MYELAVLLEPQRPSQTVWLPKDTALLFMCGWCGHRWRDESPVPNIEDDGAIEDVPRTICPDCKTEYLVLLSHSFASASADGSW